MRDNPKSRSAGPCLVTAVMCGVGIPPACGVSPLFGRLGFPWPEPSAGSQGELRSLSATRHLRPAANEENMMARTTRGIDVALVATLVVVGCMQPPSRLLVAGMPLPPLEAEGWLNGDAPTAANLQGKVVVLDAWAHW